ncbi:hypothetical protein AXF42_Ash012783 [Apostasia shenzhenica]|uniref:Uncharacterized protein n=1 Tax=Apostasia shenzhenica TaxID=1088818 RepID=A0A2I0AM74_9ASPA|nr:hypothetical protein AXF42_Ash012783 [Apostasia shenzhenica]
MRWVPTWKSLPSFRSYKHLATTLGEKRKWYRIDSTFPVQTFELAAFRHLVIFVNKEGEQFHQGVLWPMRTRYALDPNNKVFTGHDLDYFEKCVGPLLPPWHNACGSYMTGQLGMKVEGRGET